MIERWTIDSVAEEIESQFQGADPRAKLLRRFFREGKRQGKRGISWKPMKAFLENAVELATSKLAEDFVDEERGAEVALAGMRARQKMLEDDVAETDEDDDSAGADSTRSAKKTKPTAGSGPDLVAALGRLKAERAAREAAAKAATRDAKRTAAEDELDHVGEQIDVAAEEIEELDDKYRQLVDSCHETGELMWARYCSGYLLGASKRGELASPEPEPEIEFDYPDVLENDEEVPATAGVSAAEEA